ncbi:hypothetical protein ACOME3_009154 [Neoechinorhynchus agilis]
MAVEHPGLQSELKLVSDELTAIDGKLTDILQEQKILSAGSFVSGARYRHRRLRQQSLSQHHQSMEDLSTSFANDVLEDGEISGDEDCECSTKSKKLQSRVVMMDRVLKSRDELVGLVSKVPHREMVNTVEANEQWKRRNQRMFGFMMNTLNLLGHIKDFKQKAECEEDPGAKRCREVEKKHEEQIMIEHRRLARLRMELIQQKRKMLRKHEQLENKMYIVNQKGEWARTEKSLSKFIRSRAQPNIFWVPKKHNSRTRSRLDRSSEYVRIGVRRRVELLDADYRDICEQEEEDRNSTLDDQRTTEKYMVTHVEVNEPIDDKKDRMS